MPQLSLFNKGTAPKKVTYKRAVANITAALNRAHPLEVKLGNDWYARANRLAREIAEKHQIPVRAGAHIIAALSPNSRWERNVKDAKHLCDTLASGGRWDSIRVSTYNTNRDKAIAIFRAARRGEEYENILKGQKVTAFARNIENPERDRGVTVDFHAHSIAIAWRLKAHESVVSPKDYTIISRAYSDVATARALKPHQVQAITWVSWKRLHEI